MTQHPPFSVRNREQAERPRTIFCRLCSWKTADPDPAAREAQWLAHYEAMHPQPIATRCMVPPYCGWTATADDLTTLRRLRDEHEATHAPKKKPARRRRTR